MDYLKERTFEVFRYILPGILFQIVILLIFINLNKFTEILLSDKEISLWVVFLLLIFGYILGIFLDEINYRILKLIPYSKDLRDYKSKSNLSTSEKYSLLREYSKSNYTYVEYWNALKGTCHNLGLLAIFVLIQSVTKLFWLIVKKDGFHEAQYWIIIGIFSTVFAYLMYKRGFLYDSFADSERDSSVDVLNLESKVEK